MELSVGAYVVCGGIIFILLALGVSVFMDYCERRKIRKDKNKNKKRKIKKDNF